VTNEKEIFDAGLRISWWRPAAALRVTGADSFPFLQGQLTNDLARADVSEGVYTLALDRKGHVQADSFVARESPDVYWIFSERTPADALRTRLEAFIIADDVAIEDRTPEWAAVTVLGAPEQRAGASVPAGVRLWRGDTSAWTSWVFPVATAAAVHALWPAAQEVTEAEMEQRRIRAGVPAVPCDLGPGELPQEGGLEAVAISYSKGCYLGQEVMARLKSMGQVRRRLTRVRGETLPPAATPLYQGERRVGEMRTAAADGDGFVGFALLTTLALQHDLPLSEAPNQPGRITVWRG
jgi:folate-binding protein YgfZ